MENPWIQKAENMKVKAHLNEHKKSWTEFSTKQLYKSFEQRCVLTNEVLTDKQFGFARLDKTQDFHPLNCVLVRRWNIAETQEASFDWTQDQRKVIQSAHERFKSLDSV
jgi:hypothetical protein